MTRTYWYGPSRDPSRDLARAQTPPRSLCAALLPRRVRVSDTYIRTIRRPPATPRISSIRHRQRPLQEPGVAWGGAPWRDPPPPATPSQSHPIRVTRATVLRRAVLLAG